MTVEHLATDSVELGRRHAWRCRSEHRVACLGHRTTGQLQAGDVLVMIGSHQFTVPAVADHPNGDVRGAP